VERRTVREIGLGLARNYGPVSDTEIPLTIDLECRKDGVLWVGDWKSRMRVAQVQRNWQIRCAVMASMARHSEDYAMGFLGYLDDSELETAAFDAFDLSAWWDELRAMAARIRDASAAHARGETLPVSSGSWCKYCPALPYCPAHTRLALSMLGELESVDKAMSELTPEQKGRAWELAGRAEVLVARVRDSLKEQAKRAPFPLSDGRMLAMVECKGARRMNQAAVRERYAELGEAVPIKRGEPYYRVKEASLTESNDDSCDRDR